MNALEIWKSIPINSRIQIKAYSKLLCGIDLIHLCRIGLFKYREVIKILITKLKKEGLID